MSSNIAPGDISRAGIFLQGLQEQVLLECGFYSSRECVDTCYSKKLQSEWKKYKIKSELHMD